MSAEPPTTEPIATDLVAPATERTLLRGNPRLQIWLIAAVFYALLAGMCMFVLVLIIRG